ncbi:DAK2 domain-containing protein [Desertibacillus haloalkaliphilus]|uniref:DAK2 domain-containing protein n=1 Tax=Desertibacillus haloalkaliphilus TaxID=1328930 RepID=UPI001C25DB64|nr:DAK2 domain-containing protein [Desertibacillus haloalkaliphilus]MBU8907053.1 DAK2 domain-containing protein [Desertibacillus haloalkaliphilus]
MSMKVLEGKKLAQMFIEGAANLSRNAKVVDALNVFPVPDGDTGTNMNLSITSGVKEVKQHPGTKVSEVSKAFSKGLLMGARGNSGVILSQLFRGFAKGLEHKDEVNTVEFAQAFDEGVAMAYKAVMKPVEGTILTVAKDASKHAQKSAKKNDDMIVLMEEVVQEAKGSLERTPDLLPVLKEVGVVDSGGQGLVYIYEGMLAVLKGETISDAAPQAPTMDDLVKVEHHNAQSHLATEDIEFGYCTEVMVQFEEDKLANQSFNENAFREELNKLGDSLLVVSDDQLLKVHIHAEQPGEVLTKAQRYGSLINVKVDNMREQHTNLIEEQGTQGESPLPPKEEKRKEKAPFGIITVSMGEGIEKLFKGLGASVVIAGGQTMNPSTEDIMNAIEEVHAENVILLPNNGNIIMTAEQAAEVADGNVKVVPSKTVPQGLAALLAFNPQEDIDANVQTMKAAMSEVKTGEVTYAVRDTTIDGIEIKKDDYMGIFDKKIVSSGSEQLEVARNLLAEMLDDDAEIVTIIQGEDASEAETNELVSFVEEAYDEVEVEVHTGSQPLYSYLFSVE